jgi:hypothetical protein
MGHQIYEHKKDVEQIQNQPQQFPLEKRLCENNNKSHLPNDFFGHIQDLAS